ncbi:MAG: hypothetical protein AB7P69_16295 [Candidatus Binatia bacterium]
MYRNVSFATVLFVLGIFFAIPSVTHSAPAPRPDYFVSSSVEPYFVTNTITIKYSVANLSDASAPATQVKFMMAPTDTPEKKQLIGSGNVPALRPWQNVQRTVQLRIPGSRPAGLTWMQLISQVNPGKQQPENNIANNITVTGFGLQNNPPPPPPLADLTVSKVTAPDTIQAGAILSMADTVQNIGTGDASAVSVAYLLKTGENHTQLGSRSINKLPKGSANSGGMNIALPLSIGPGAYILVVKSDSIGSDGNPLNNQREKAIIVASANPPLSPPDGTFLQDKDIHKAPNAPRPPLHAPFIDPTFGSTITRLTDPSMSPSNATHQTFGLRHEYARYPAINADNTKMIITVIGGVQRGFFEVREMNGTLLHRITPSGDPEISWHPTDPNRLFYRFANEIRTFSVDTGQSETVMSFPQYYYISTRQEGRPSDDWRYYAFIGYLDSSFSSADLVVVDLVEKRIVATIANAGIPDWVSMSPSGKYVVAQWVSGEGTRIYDRKTLTVLRNAFSDYAHSDFAFDAEGNEVLVYYATSGKQLAELGNPSGAPLAAARLADGRKTVLLSLDWDIALHVSGIASRAHPGWVLISTYTDSSTSQQPFARELFWLKLDGSGAVRRIAHHHSDLTFRATPWGGQEKDYFAEPQATSSWDGDIVLFSSVWGASFNHYDLYAVTGQWWGN